MRFFSSRLWSDLKHSLRVLSKDRAVTAVSVLLLGLGIGFAFAVFTVFWQAVYAQLPVPEPEQIFTFETNVTHNGRSDSDANAQTFSLPTYRYLAGHLGSGMEMVARHGEMVNVNSSSGPRHLLADFVSSNFFAALNIRPVLGRAFKPDSDTPPNDRLAAVISYDFWHDAYGGQPAVWNSYLPVNGLPFRIVGVAPPGFAGLISGQAPKLYLPLESFANLNPGWTAEHDWSVRWLNAFLRLPRKMSPRSAEAVLQPVYRAAVREELAAGAATDAAYLAELSHEHLSLVPASEGAHAVLDQWQEPLRVLQWMTGAMLFLAVLNVAGLLVSRAFKSRREVLIRYALGATKGLVIRLQLMQTLLLSLAGGTLAYFVSDWGARLLVHLARPDHDSSVLLQPPAWMLVAHWSATLITGLLVGLLPAWQSSRVDLAEGLKADSNSHSGSRSQKVIRRSVAAVQIALSLVLAISAGLFAQALHNLVSAPVGFNPEHLTIFSIDPKLAGASIESAQLLWGNIERRIKQTPGVEAATFGTGGPFPQDADAAVVIPGNSAAQIPHHQSGLRSLAGPGYFSTLGIPLVQGREFDDRDRANMPGVVILNQTLARKLFGAENAIGRLVTLFNGLDPNWQATVVGVVADHHQTWKRTQASLLYTPAMQSPRLTNVTYYVRTRAPLLGESAIRNLLRSEAPGISPFDVTTMPARMAEFASQERAMALLVSLFALLALVIAGVGVYGVVAYAGSTRAVEFAVRMSVGARSSDIAWLVLREAVVTLTAGISLAVPLTIATLAVIRQQLASVSIHQLAPYTSAVALLALCCMLAAAIPVFKSGRRNVIDELRHS